MGPPPRSLLGLPPVRSRPLVRAREGLRALRRWTRNSNRRSRPRRNRRRSRRRNRSRVRHQTTKPQQVKSPPAQPRHRNADRGPGRERFPLRRSRVLRRRRPKGLPVPGRPLVPYPYGIRRRRQHLNKASGRGWGLAGRPNGLKGHGRSACPAASGSSHAAGANHTQWGAIPDRSDRSGRAAEWSAGAAAPDAWGSAWGPSWTLSLGPVLDLSPGVPVGPGAAAAAGLAAAASTQVRPQAPAGQPGTPPQGPVRPSEPTGRTPAPQGGAPVSPVAPPSGPQARVPTGPAAPPTRMPGPPMQPAAPMQSRYRARRATQQGTSASVQVRKARRLTPTTRGSPRLA